MDNFCILKLEPGQAPEITYIEDTLNAMQDLLGGSMESKFPWDDPVVLVENGLSRLIGMPVNFILIDPDTGEALDIFCGPFFICGMGDKDFTSLSPELAEKYLQVFTDPKKFRLFGNDYPAIPV